MPSPLKSALLSVCVERATDVIDGRDRSLLLLCGACVERCWPGAAS